MYIPTYINTQALKNPFKKNIKVTNRNNFFAKLSRLYNSIVKNLYNRIMEP